MASKSTRLTNEDLNALKAAFTFIDENKDGKISFFELKSLFKSQNLELSDKKLQKFFNFFGPDKNNCIDFERFIKFMSNDFENSFAKDPTSEKKFDPNNPKDLLELTVAFARIDVNRDGKLSREEFQSLFNAYGISEMELDAFFYALECDESGCIEFKEFVKIVSGDYEPDEHTVAKNMFHAFDKDRDGFISFEEFKLMAKRFFKISDEDDLREDFERIDKNGDKKLSLDEFLAEMNDENQNRLAAKSLFKANDSDKDGLIEFGEFKTIAKHLNITLSDKELMEDFEAIDENEDRKINFEEFFDYFGNNTFN